MISEIADSSVGIISLFDMSLIALVDIVVERIFEGNGVGFIGALGFNG